MKSLNNYRSLDLERARRDEERLKELTEGTDTNDENDTDNVTTETSSDVDDTSLSAEEKSFKKRYGDLRSYSAKEIAAREARIKALEEQLATSAQSQLVLPKTEEEQAEWESKYPDVAKHIEMIALRKHQALKQELDDLRNQLSTKEHSFARERAYAELLTAHPDFEKIKEDAGFHEWIEKQPQYIIDALYVNETDAKAAIRAVDLYKADLGLNKSTKSNSTQSSEAASSVRVASFGTSPTEGDRPKFTESMLKRMSPREREANWDAIEKAMQHPAFYDISGAAR